MFLKEIDGLWVIGKAGVEDRRAKGDGQKLRNGWDALDEAVPVEVEGDKERENMKILLISDFLVVPKNSNWEESQKTDKDREADYKEKSVLCGANQEPPAFSHRQSSKTPQRCCEMLSWVLLPFSTAQISVLLPPTLKIHLYQGFSHFVFNRFFILETVLTYLVVCLGKVPDQENTRPDSCI